VHSQPGSAEVRRWALGGSGVAAAASCALASLLVASAIARADAVDPVAAAKRLRQTAASIEPLPETGSGITRDVGSIAVIEYDDRSYDRNLPDGTPNYAARVPVALRFYEDHGDLYDFLVVFTNFEFDTAGATAFYSLVRNDVTGIGKLVTDNGDLFGSPSRLKGYVDMAAVARYREDPFGVEPGQRGYLRTLSTLLHEVGHQWLAEARYRNASGQVSTDMLGWDGVHWSYLLDSDASHLLGSDWVANGGGVYTAARVREIYSPLDLYLMGFLDPSGVPDFTLLRNPAVDPTGLPVEGATVTAAPETVAIGQVIDAMGPRGPDQRHSQKEFRLGFVFLVRPGQAPTAADLDAVDRIRRTFAALFFAQTRGVAVADTALAEAPPAPPAPAPDLDRALAWLLSRQSIDGRWEDSAGTSMRDTPVALDALREAGETGLPYQRGRLWAQLAQPANVDFAARRAAILGPEPTPGLDRAALGNGLLALRNPDGGFGAGPGYQSDPLDTSFVLRALKALGHPGDGAVRAALTFLRDSAHPAGGWSAVAGGEVSTLATAHVLLALEDWAGLETADSLVGPALTALLARRNPDGGFGESPSTAYATGLVLQALLRAGAPQEIVDGAIGWLQSTQLADGSWSGSAHETALALGALKAGLGANLTVSEDGLVLDPAQPDEGDVVQVTFFVRNTGRRPAPATKARLFDGDPSGSGVAVSDVGVPALGPGEQVTLSLRYPTADRAGNRTLYVVVDPDGEVAESKENDNTARRSLRVEGLLPDLTIRPGDLTVTPHPPEEGETAQVSITVTNQGERPAPASLVRLYDGSPQTGGRLLGQAPVPPLAIGESSAVVLPWDTTGAAGNHVLVAVANADYGVQDRDPGNDSLSLMVPVLASLPPVDLSTALTLSPAALSTLPQTIEVRAEVRNLGRDPVTTNVALYDSPPPSAALEERLMDLGPRSATTVVFTVTVDTSGNRTFRVAADPSNQVYEPDEENNVAVATLVDPADTLDLEILSGDVSAPSTIVVGETLTVTAVVRNRGTAAAPPIPVQLGHVTDEGVRELTRTEVVLAAGASTTVTLAWTSGFTGDAVPLVVRADPFQLLAEASEENNDAAFVVTIRPSASTNLAVSGADVSFTPDPPREGEPAVVAALVRNPSAVDAPAFAVSFYRGDPEQGGVPIAPPAEVASLAAGAAVMASVEWSPVDARGAQGVFVIVDPLGQVQEYDETDNRAFRPFSVLGLPDLVLTVGGVALEPPFPRAGEPVQVRATIFNQGAQRSASALLRAFEGQPLTGLLISELPIPELDPGRSATLQLSWNPASPPGERPLSLVADADGVVREQDEGNNVARRSVVVQDADLYLTAPYFSPDGDGVRDDTTLAYRATGTVAVVVSDGRGRRVRTLAESAPASGSLPWDGRDDRGRLLRDGSYTVSVLGEGGGTLGRASVVLDTNRSPLHDAAGTGLTASWNLTCGLPVSISAPAWMPGEDAVLFITAWPTPGLILKPLEGEVRTLFEDPWFGGAQFASEDPVSPDGREVLLLWGASLHAFDLESGSRRLLAGDSSRALWSPDGRFILSRDQVLRRADGQVVGTLPFFCHNSGCLDWVWSPDGEFLAAGNRIVRRDGSGERLIPVPVPDGADTAIGTQWRGDGKIVASFASCTGPEGSCNEQVTTWALDPDAETATELAWLAGRFPGGLTWSPDGSRVLYRGASGATLVAREDGSGALQLWPTEVALSPRASAASYAGGRPEGSTCAPESLTDTFALTSLQNLTASFRASRLPGNNGIPARVRAAVDPGGLASPRTRVGGSRDRRRPGDLGAPGSGQVPVPAAGPRPGGQFAVAHPGHHVGPGLDPRQRHADGAAHLTRSALPAQRRPDQGRRDLQLPRPRAHARGGAHHGPGAAGVGRAHGATDGLRTLHGRSRFLHVGRPGRAGAARPRRPIYRARERPPLPRRGGHHTPRHRNVPREPARRDGSGETLRRPRRHPGGSAEGGPALARRRCPPQGDRPRLRAGARCGWEHHLRERCPSRRPQKRPGRGSPRCPRSPDQLHQRRLLCRRGSRRQPEHRARSRPRGALRRARAPAGRLRGPAGRPSPWPAPDRTWPDLCADAAHRVHRRRDPCR
jgi:subtilase family serine protease